MKNNSFVRKLYLLAVAAFLLVAGCDGTQSDPPVAITIRGGALSDFVLQISNMSSGKSLEVYLYVADDTHSARSGNFILHPNTTKELGALEMDWNFKRGDQGFVSVGGMEKKLFFRVTKNGEYNTWFGIDDIPEVDVAAQVRARREAERKAKLEAATKATVIAGRELFVLVTEANVEREAIGLAPIWPRFADVYSDEVAEKGVVEKLKGWKSKIAAKFGGKQDVAKYEADIPEIKFTSSGEYFFCLFDAANIGKENHRPYVNASNLLVVASGVRNGVMPPESVRWSVLADYEDEMAECIPMLVSSNFPCERLCSFWDGKTGANEVIGLLPVGELGDEVCVIVYKSGKAKALPASRVTLANIYDGPFNTLANGCNKALLYLTPHGVQPTSGAMGNLAEVRIEAARSLIKNIEAACILYNMEHGGKYPSQLSDLQKGDDGNPPLLEGEINDPWGNEIKYEKKGKRIRLVSFGPDGKEGTDDDLTNIRHQ